jgi:hypothetical protein
MQDRVARARVPVFTDGAVADGEREEPALNVLNLRDTLARLGMLVGAGVADAALAVQGEIQKAT